jgi:hypothetical protein
MEGILLSSIGSGYHKLITILDIKVSLSDLCTILTERQVMMPYIS